MGLGATQPTHLDRTTQPYPTLLLDTPNSPAAVGARLRHARSAGPVGPALPVAGAPCCQSSSPYHAGPVNRTESPLNRLTCTCAKPHISRINPEMTALARPPR